MATPYSKRVLHLILENAMHGKNARAVLPPEAWAQVRRIVHGLHGYQCADCGGTRNLECHEVWEYCWIRQDAKNVPVMRLSGLRTLCHLCHMGKHVGCARRRGELAEVQVHLQRIYGITAGELDDVVRASNELVRRQKFRYELDLSYLNQDQFAVVHTMLGRKLTTNEIKNCRHIALS